METITLDLIKWNYIYDLILKNFFLLKFCKMFKKLQAITKYSSKNQIFKLSQQKGDVRF